MDLDYEDDDIFGEEDEEIQTYSEEYMGPQLKPKSVVTAAVAANISSSSTSSSSSMSNPYMNEQNKAVQLPSLNEPFISNSSSGKSFISSSSSSSSSMSPAVLQLSKFKAESAKQNVFNFIPQQQSANKMNKLTRLPPQVPQAPPPLPSTSQSSQSANLNEINYSIVASLQNFAHFDTQSVLFNYDYVRLIKDTLQFSINMRTGASAASKQPGLDLKGQSNNPKPASSKLRGHGVCNSISSVLGSLESHSSSIDETCIAGDMKSAVNKRGEELNESNRLSSSLYLYSNEDARAANLVEECACFRLEVGGDVFKGLGLSDNVVSQRRMMRLNSVSILDRMNAYYKKEIVELIEANGNEPFTIEFQDWGAYFYRFYFANHEHANYLGVDADVGPVALSIKREKLLVDNSRNYSTNTVSYHNNSEKSYEYAYRFIFRTSSVRIFKF